VKNAADHEERNESDCCVCMTQVRHPIHDYHHEYPHNTIAPGLSDGDHLDSEQDLFNELGYHRNRKKKSEDSPERIDGKIIWELERVRR
jgi:hypothetical protein